MAFPYMLEIEEYKYLEFLSSLFLSLPFPFITIYYILMKREEGYIFSSIIFKHKKYKILFEFAISVIDQLYIYVVT